MPKLLLGLILLMIGAIAFIYIKTPTTLTSLPIPIPTVLEKDPFPYSVPVIPSKRAYITFLVGDSITEALGLNAQGLREKLLALYPQHEFVTYNYGYGATNILSVNDRLTKDTMHKGSQYPPILKQGFDLIILESFAYNPLSDSTGQGLEKYKKTLDETVRLIIKEKPDAVIALMTPIAPNKENFAKYNYDLSPEERLNWVNERVSYIEAFIEYAKSKNLPLINVYEKSLTTSGNGDLKYIDSHDYIHPSVEGKILIEKTIADFIFQNKIFPQ